MTADASPARPLVVGYDGREPSERALSRAIDEAKTSGSPVRVLVVVGMPVAYADPYDPGAIGMGYLPPIPEGGPSEAQPLLREARRRLDDEGVSGEVNWSMGDPASELLREAQEHDARAIVIGAHHHSALARLFGADTAADVISDATCEVLVEK
jgi:nucleotide-binding universal stress UspA family protein